MRSSPYKPRSTPLLVVSALLAVGAIASFAYGIERCVFSFASPPADGTKRGAVSHAAHVAKTNAYGSLAIGHFSAIGAVLAYLRGRRRRNASSRRIIGACPPAPQPVAEEPSEDRFEWRRLDQGVALTDLRTGLVLVFPGFGARIPGRAAAPGAPAFDVGFQLAEHDVEVRLRVDHRASGSMGPSAGPLLARMLCYTHAAPRSRTPLKVGLVAAEQLTQWNVDGAASATYELVHPDGDFDHEQCVVLTRGSPATAVVLTRLLSSRRGMTGARWGQLEARLDGGMRWGSEPTAARDSATVAHRAVCWAARVA